MNNKKILNSFILREILFPGEKQTEEGNFKLEAEVIEDLNTYEIMSWEKFEAGCCQIVEQIKASGKEYKNVLGIPRGGLILAVRLSHLLSLPLVFSPDSLDSLKGTLVCDDVSDTGETLKDCLYDKVTLYIKPGTETMPEYYAFQTDKWIEFPWEKK